jgi:serine/threonine protein kinase
LTSLNSDGVFYIRGVKYTIRSYLGGGAFGKVWKAQRSMIDEGYPLHDQADTHDSVAPLLNLEFIAIKICQSHTNNMGKLLLREIQLTSRTSHFVPGVLRLVAASPMVNGAFGVEGTVRGVVPY